MNTQKCEAILAKLNDVMDMLDGCDEQTYAAIDGPNMYEDILVYAKQIANIVDPVE